MPFLGGAMGAGHSELGNRFEYLKASFWCVRPSPRPTPTPPSPSPEHSLLLTGLGVLLFFLAAWQVVL